MSQPDTSKINMGKIWKEGKALSDAAEARAYKIFAAVDPNDPDQIKMAGDEIALIRQELFTQFSKLMMDEIIRIAVIEPLAAALGLNFASGGTLAADKPRICEKHNIAMVQTTSHDLHGLPARSFLSCPACNAEAIDRMNAKPGTISIRIGDK